MVIFFPILITKLLMFCKFGDTPCRMSVSLEFSFLQLKRPRITFCLFVFYKNKCKINQLLFLKGSFYLKEIPMHNSVYQCQFL